MVLNTTERIALAKIAAGEHADVARSTIRRLKERGLVEGRSRLSKVGKAVYSEIAAAS